MNYVTIGSFWIGYDDVEAIRTKVSYAKDKGLLGFAALQIPSDDVDWELSKAGDLQLHPHMPSRVFHVLWPNEMSQFLNTKKAKILFQV
ncbi:hypothetical protein RND71_005540 [Anisodus tanguticus]|uniref:GH18 domain-containing protein n=1 Tax=Anisodus tanguticus TaxID=243964 RepID=A0AAE1SP76_9SOLA|nr:hypothetical protein RND71_005540 [Anisodus tanguticus]